ncbi:GOLPH3/VPS74 family protein [Streptomyces sp. CWNU-52B]|uniref:GOLPH3/VPS74 family protein n=1 Tax=unclassified Streptomyces TaxID=2593676 RepID=UPI0039BF7C8F
MTTPRDLLISTMDVEPGRPVEQGDLSLALAGAELIDLRAAQALALDGDRIVPGAQQALGDRLLDEAASALTREKPYESVEDWLWRRGRGLSSAYLAALDVEGDLTRPRHQWIPFRNGAAALTDSPARRRAADRRSSDEPVLAFLAAAVGLHDEPAEDVADHVDDAVVTVLAAVNDAVRELEAVRQRRSIEDAAFNNIWRGQ